MSNIPKEHPSIRVVAPPGGRTTNIFGVPEPEASVSTKKNHMESDIFGCKKDNVDVAPVKQTRTTMTNNIFGAPTEQPAPRSSVYSEKNKSSIFDEAPPQQASSKPDRQRSNIFGAGEPAQSAPTRPVSEKYKSSIFGTDDNNAQGKRQLGGRQGLRVGYNPINGEPYSTKDGLNSKVEEQTDATENEKESDETNQTPEEPNGHDKLSENGHSEVSADTNENGNVEPSMDKQTNGHSNATNGQTTTAKNAHTTVRVAHPPGGRSNGPLW